MAGMKTDMGGSAAVLGAFEAAYKSGKKIHFILLQFFCQLICRCLHGRTSAILYRK